MKVSHSKFISFLAISICLILVTSCSSEQYTEKRGTVHVDLKAEQETVESAAIQSERSENQSFQSAVQVQQPAAQMRSAAQTSQPVQSQLQSGIKKDEQPVSNVTFTPKPSPVDPEKAAEADRLYEQGFQVFLTFKYDEAIKLFDRALSFDPNSYKAYNGKGIALCYKGSYKEGMQLIDRALSLKPDFPYANFNKALGFKLMKDYKSALIWFDRAISYDPANTWSYFGIACIYAEWKDADKAVEYLKKAIETDPGAKDVAKREHDLDPIRNDPGFIKLLQ